MKRPHALALALALALPLTSRAQPHPPPTRPTPHNARRAPANASPRIEVLVLEAGAGDGGIPPALAGLSPLRQPPFNAFGEYRVLSRSTLPLAAAPSSARLPNGSASVTLRDQADGRYSVSVAFEQGGATSTIEFVARAGEPFFTVRSSRPDRALVIGFIVR